MNYEEFAKEYVRLVKKAINLCNDPDDVHQNFSSACSAVSDLVELYPEYEKRADHDPSIWKACDPSI